MATQDEILALTIQEAKELDVHTLLTDLIGKAVIVYDKTTGSAMSFDADILSGRQKVVLGTAEEIEAKTKTTGVFYCTYEEEET